MGHAESRATEEIERLEGRVRLSLAGSLLALLVGLAVTLPAVWTLTGQFLSIELERNSFLLRSGRGEVRIQQTVAPEPGRYAIYFTVQTPEGQPVKSLEAADLELSTDELGAIGSFELAPAADPLTLFTALDTSVAAGMAGLVGPIRQQTGPWVHGLSVYQVALIACGAPARVDADLGPPEARFPRALERLMPSGESALFDGVMLAADRAQGRETRMALMLVAASRDTASHARLGDAWARAHAASLPVFAIGLGDAVDRTALEELGRKTGGRALFATDVSLLPALFGDIGALLGAQHRITTAARQPRPGADAARATATALAAGLLVGLYVAIRRWTRAPQLVVLGGPKHGLSVRLVSDILICGSDPGCHLQVPGELHTTAGRRFALERRGPVVSFHLLDPSGATTINRAVVESRDLATGDVIRAGLARFLFFRYEPGEKAPAPIAAPRAASRVTGPFWLVSEDGGPTFKVDGERVRVGREPDNDIVLEDPSVSRRHGEFLKGDEGWVLADLGSRNGTYLGEARVAAEAALFEGAHVRFGRIQFSVSRMRPGDEPFEFGDEVTDSTCGRAASVVDGGTAPVPRSPDAAAGRAGSPEPAPAEPEMATASAPVPEPPPAAPEPPQPRAEEGPCPVCGHVNRPSARYCTQCGEKLV